MRPTPRQAIRSGIAWLRRTDPVDRAAALFIAFAFVALATLAVFGFHSFPHSADEWNFEFQARTFAAGRLKNPALPGWLRDSGLLAVPPHTISRGSVYSKYPPGWPVILAFGERIGVPAIVNPLLGAMLLATLYALVRRVVDRKSALITILLVGTSSFFLINSASFYSHTLVALTIVFVLDVAHRYLVGEVPRARHCVLGAVAFGLLTLTRPYDALLFAPAVVILAVLAVRRFGRRTVRSAIVSALIVLGCVLVFLAYNKATTGKALVFGHGAMDKRHFTHELRVRNTPVLAVARAEYQDVALPVEFSILAAAWLLFRPRRIPRFAIVIALIAAAGPWLGYTLRNPPIPIHYGPRYQFASLPFLAAFLGVTLARIPRRGLLVVTVGVASAIQLTMAARYALDLSHTLYRGMGCSRAATALAAAIRPQRAVVVAHADSGSVAVWDLPRNDIDTAGPVLIVHGPSWNSTVSFAQAGRTTYVWDGLPGLPVLWSWDPNSAVQQLILTEPAPTIRRRSNESGWLVTWNRTACSRLDSRSTALGTSMPGLRPETDVGFGPCSGEPSGAATSPDGRWRTTSGGPASVQLRAFVVGADGAATLSSNGIIYTRVFKSDQPSRQLPAAVTANGSSIFVGASGAGTLVAVTAFHATEDVELSVTLSPGLVAYTQVPAPRDAPATEPPR